VGSGKRKRMTTKCSHWIAALVVCLIVGGAWNARAQLPVDREYLIKAAFLYNFLKFVEWPTDVLPEGARTISICVIGEDPFGDALDSLKGKSVQDKSVEIKRVQALQDLKACHLLFISSSAKARLGEIMEAVKGTSLLTVSELERFTERGGIIRLFLERNNVRFEINVDIAARARLKMGSRLLSLAKIVKG
jgi:hypothetical protein